MLNHINLQLFAENENENENEKENENIEETKTFSADYVKALREEAKNYRLQLREMEKKNENILTKIRKNFGLEENETIDNIDELFTNFRNKTMQKSNDILLQAELLKRKTKYNEKLFDRLFEKEKVSIDENGTIIGLDEHLQELEKEFPEIVKITDGGNDSGLNPGIDSDRKIDISKMTTAEYIAEFNKRKKF